MGKESLLEHTEMSSNSITESETPSFTLYLTHTYQLQTDEDLGGGDLIIIIKKQKT